MKQEVEGTVEVREDRIPDETTKSNTPRKSVFYPSRETVGEAERTHYLREPNIEARSRAIHQLVSSPPSRSSTLLLRALTRKI